MYLTVYYYINIGNHCMVLEVGCIWLAQCLLKLEKFLKTKWMAKKVEMIWTISSCIWITTEVELSQVSTLLFCMGEEAEDVLTSTNIIVDERKEFDKALTEFDDYFKVHKNVIFEKIQV